MKGVGTLIKIGIHTLMEHEQENMIQKIKEDKKFQTQDTPHSTFVVFVSICRNFEVFAVFWCFVDRCFDSFTTPN